MTWNAPFVGCIGVDEDDTGLSSPALATGLGSTLLKAVDRRRRPSLSRVRALTIALIASVLLSFLQFAYAYTPGSYPVAATDDPQITATLSHSQVNGAAPKQGDLFTYTATYNLTGMTVSGVTRKTTIVLNADANAPFTGTNPTFQLGTQTITPATSSCSATQCTFTFNNLGDGQLTITKQAQVAASAGKGVPISATTQVTTATNATVSLKEVSKGFALDATSPVGTCSGVYTLSERVSDAGAWLLDIKFADAAGQDKVRLDANAQILAWNAPGAGTNTIRFTDAAGNDITASVMAKATYNPDDPSQPYFPGDAISTSYPDAKWLDSLNYGWDASTWTGNNWLPAGTVITVTRHVTYTNCSGGATTDFDTQRPFGMSVEVARPLTTIKAFAFDEFATPGMPTPSQCTTLYRSTQSGYIYTWPANTSTYTPGGEISGLAISPLHPERLYYYTATATGLHYRDTSTNTTTNFAFPTGVTSTNMMGFGPDGTLWMVGVQDGALYSMADGATTWTSLGSIGLSGDQGDLVLDAAGNMHIMYMSPSPRIRNISASELTKTSGITYADVTVTGSTDISANYWYGIAYGADGNLYVSATNNGGSLSYMYVLDPTTGALTSRTTVASGLANGIRATMDLASCSFGAVEPPLPTGPVYKWQKSVINPDGSVAAAGTTGKLTTVNPDGTITVRYLITVSNVGVQTGVHPTITDNVRVPAGFTITGITTTGTAATAPTWSGNTGSFAIAGQSLNPATGEGTSATYLVTVNARTDLAAMTSTQWTQAGTCNTTAAGTPTAGGFFNTAQYATTDSDGANNNDACVPVQPTTSGKAHLALIKRIVDSTGAEVAAWATDARFFNLIAGGRTPGDQTPGLVGAAPSSGRWVSTRMSSLAPTS